MSLERLLREGKIKRVEPDSAVARKSLRLANRDLAVAENILENGDYDWALIVAYNAMLQASRGADVQERVSADRNIQTHVS